MFSDIDTQYNGETLNSRRSRYYAGIITVLHVFLVLHTRKVLKSLDFHGFRYKIDGGILAMTVWQRHAWVGLKFVSKTNVIAFLRFSNTQFKTFWIVGIVKF